MAARPRLLLIASKAGYQTDAFAAAAVRQDVQLHLATNRCHQLEDPWQDGAIALDFENLDLENRYWDGIAAVGDEGSGVAAVLAEKLGLRYHPVNAVRLCRSKFETRERWRQAGLLTPVYSRVAIEAGPSALVPPFPCVLKPIGLSASRGVIRANDPAEFAAAFDRIASLLTRTPDLMRQPASSHIQVEAFIPGREFAVEALMAGGQLRILAVFDKPDSLDGPFFEETIYTTPSREPPSIHQAIRDTTQQAVAALGLSDGPIHAECRVNEQGVWMLEVAARPIGGLCARVLQFESGSRLEDIIVRHAIGKAVDSEKLGSLGSAVMMIPIPKSGIYQAVKGVEAAKRVPGIDSIEITAVPGQRLIPLPEGASYLGFIFAHAAHPAEAEQAVRDAHAELEFEIQTALTVI